MRSPKRKPNTTERSPIRGLDENKRVSSDQNSINLNQFKVALFEAAIVIYKNFNPFEGCVMLLRDHILPIGNQISDEKSIYNQKIQNMINSIEQDQVIEVMTDLREVLFKIYDHYSDHKGHMDFQAFMKFTTDFSIFPDIVNKGDLFRIFQNLAFPNGDRSKF